MVAATQKPLDICTQLLLIIPRLPKHIKNLQNVNCSGFPIKAVDMSHAGADGYEYLDNVPTRTNYQKWFCQKYGVKPSTLNAILTGKRHLAGIKLEWANLFAKTATEEPATDPLFWIQLPLKRRHPAFYKFMKEPYDKEMEKEHNSN